MVTMAYFFPEGNCETTPDGVEMIVLSIFYVVGNLKINSFGIIFFKFRKPLITGWVGGWMD